MAIRINLSGLLSVLVEGNKITKITAPIEAPHGATVIDAGGRTMSRGFINAHAHAMFIMPCGEGNSSYMLYHVLNTAAMTKIWLSRGCTIMRDIDEAA